jgi:hypothetical protein
LKSGLSFEIFNEDNVRTDEKGIRWLEGVTSRRCRMVIEAISENHTMALIA